MVRVLGIDPGLAKVGWGILDAMDIKSNKCISGRIETDKKDTLPFRIAVIVGALETLICYFNPEFLAIESLSYSKTIGSSTDVAQVKGAILYMAVRHKIGIAEYNPSTVKKAFTGSGKATKEQMKKMADFRWPGKKFTPDEVDALAVAWAMVNKNKPIYDKGASRSRF